MPYSNRMTKLIDKIEMDLGTDAYNLPPHLTKDKWADKAIKLKTLDTFSRYFPNKVTMEFNTHELKTKDGYYVIDEDKIGPNVEILGIKDIPWDDINALGAGVGYVDSMSPYGLMDSFPASLSYDDIATCTMLATEGSLLNRGIYIDFKYPNLVKLKTAIGVDGDNMGISKFKLDIFVKHNANLLTIAPTKMETFEALAEADVATFLYNKLKFFDGIETVFSNVDMHMQELQEAAAKRADVVQELKDGYVSMANQNQPGIMCI